VPKAAPQRKTNPKRKEIVSWRPGCMGNTNARLKKKGSQCGENATHCCLWGGGKRETSGPGSGAAGTVRQPDVKEKGEKPSKGGKEKAFFPKEKIRVEQKQRCKGETGGRVMKRIGK